MLALDRVKELTAAAQSGTGNFNLNGAATGFKSFAAAFGAGRFQYTILGATAGEWEVGICDVTSGSPDVLNRSAGSGGIVLASSNADAIVSFTSGQHTVFGTLSGPVVQSLTLPYTAHTITSGDTAMVAGRTNNCTISGASGAIGATLPIPKFIGQRIIVRLASNAAATVGRELVIKGVATVTINGGAAATEWSRLMIANEIVAFQATSLTNWDLHNDGRIAQVGSQGLDTSQTHNDASAFENFPFTVEIGTSKGLIWTQGAVHNVSSPTPTKGTYTVRRQGYYLIVAQYRTNTAPNDAAAHILALDGGNPVHYGRFNTSGANNSQTIRAAAMPSCNQGAVLGARFFNEKIDTGVSGATNDSFFYVREML